MDDQQLLKSYTAEKSDDAFRQLVERHLGLVYATALRTVGGDVELARDVAQLVFVHLTLKAHTLRADVALAGWLHRITVLTALEILRKERRRHALEEEAAVMNKNDPNPAENTGDRILSLLDVVLSQMNTKDRDVLLMRYFEQQSLTAIGERFGFGESGASHRVSRALDKLRGLLSARGVTISGSALATVIGSLSTGTVPTGLAATVSSVALAAGAAATSALTSGVAHLLTSFKVKLGLAALAATVVVSPIVVYQHQTVQALRGNTLALERQIQRLQAQLALPAAPQSIPTELLRLRGQVARLRRELDERSAPTARLAIPAGLSPTQRSNLSDAEHWVGGKFLPKENLSNMGLATPEAAVQTYLWALLQLDPAISKSVLSAQATLDIELERDEFASCLETSTGLFFANSARGPDSLVAQLQIQDKDDQKLMKRVQLDLEGGIWRIVSDQWTPLHKMRPPTTPPSGPNAKSQP